MPTFKLKGAKAQETKTGFEPYDGPTPKARGFYRAIIKVMKHGLNSGSGSQGFEIVLELEAAKGDPKDHAQFNGYPMFSRSIITETKDGSELKEGAVRNLDNLLAALGTKDEPDVVLGKGDEDKLPVLKIGGINPIGRVVNVDMNFELYEGERRPTVGGIYPYKEIEVAAGSTYEPDEEEDESDLMEGSDEAEETEEGEDEFAARKAELEAMGVAALRKLAKEDYDLVSSGTKAAVIERILDWEFSDEEDAEGDEAEEADEPEEDEAEEDEAEEEDEEEEADEEDDEAKAERVAELAAITDRPALKSILKEIAPDFTVLKRHTDDDLRAQIISVEFAEDLPF